MARSATAATAAAKATEAAEALTAWLQAQPRTAAPATKVDAAADSASPDALPPDAGPDGESGGTGGPTGTASPEADPCQGAVSAAGGNLGEAAACAARPTSHGDATTAAVALPQPDWLHHRLAITGPADRIGAFRVAAAGAGIVPWHLYLDRMEEDCFLLLAAPASPRGAPARPGALPGWRTLRGSPTPPGWPSLPEAPPLSVAGARVLAGQLREAVARRHEIAVARVGRSQACPFDLNALLPVPAAILRLGPDDPAALTWLWTHWGTTQALRQVALDHGAAEDPRRRPPPGEAALHLTFWSADWTPWRALARLAEIWPSLRFAVRPTYDPA